MSRARIVVGAIGNDGEIEIDGHRVEHYATAFRLTSGVGELTRLQLELVLHKGVTFDGDVEVELPQGVRDLLQRLGWRPPAD